MRLKTQLGNVVSSHSAEWGASSFCANLRIDSRSCSCSSVKMKWRLRAPKSGLRTLEGAEASAGAETGLVMPGRVDSRTSYFQLVYPHRNADAQVVRLLLCVLALALAAPATAAAAVETHG